MPCQIDVAAARTKCTVTRTGETCTVRINIATGGGHRTIDGDRTGGVEIYVGCIGADQRSGRVDGDVAIGIQR